MDVDHNFPVPVPVPLPTQTAAPSLTVPGVWAFCASGQTADVLECSFMLDKDTAAQWNVYDPDPESAPRAEYTTKQLHLQLYCIPLVAARANVMSNAQIEWPKKGLFIVEVNRGTSVGRMFVPDHEKPLPVNITHAVQKGLNIVRFIQLVGMESAFIIHASEETVPILDTTLP
ncbi:hypothetical protein BDZ89DRAFT_1128893 [Hymenopellis radicata]|nr:hypothetical protein BDZ89DRAFT_1128893 [Hymenopellis radicata]